jgi:hypothetical protein
MRLSGRANIKFGTSWPKNASVAEFALMFALYAIVFQLKIESDWMTNVQDAENGIPAFCRLLAASRAGTVSGRRSRKDIIIGFITNSFERTANTENPSALGAERAKETVRPALIFRKY